MVIELDVYIVDFVVLFSHDHGSGSVWYLDNISYNLIWVPLIYFRMVLDLSLFYI